MERECKGIAVQAMIGDHKLAITCYEHLKPFTSLTLHTWFDYTDFKPNCTDSRLKYWINKCITAYCNIMENNDLQSFQTLREKIYLGKV